MLSLITAVLGAVPVIGTIVSSFFNMKTQMANINATRDVSEEQISAQIIAATIGDMFVRICRDIILFFGTVWFALGIWDTIIGARDKTGHLYHPWAADWMWHIAEFPPQLAYLPYAVIVFLLGAVGINMWNRK